jgi:ADP-dependent glucokinase
MLSIESRVKINKDLNVAVGFGSCLDIFVSSRQLILDRHKPPEVQVHHENIRTQDQLNELMAYFFNEGAAAERYIDNRTFFLELVKLAESSEGSRKAIGGNAATMAKRFVLEGVDRVMLGTQLSKKNSDQYNDRLVISGPMVDLDDVHICIEYPAGEKWGAYVAPRANRLIIHSDYYNPALKSVDNFITRLESAKNLDLLVIGGLQMMDNTPIPIEDRKEKLSRLNRVLERLPPGRPQVHMELASFTEEALLEAIRDLIIPHVDSLGMNEQELPMLLNYLNEGGVNTRSESYPRVATILDQMRQLFKKLYKPTRGRLSRMHAHTLAFQAIMTRVGSNWKNSLTSSVKAALTAHRYTCGSDEIDMAKAKLIMDESYTTSKEGSRRRIPFNPKHPVVCWQEDILVDDTSNPTSHTSTKTETIEICVAPVLVCTKVRQTGGAGDNVSAAGLIFQF